MLGAVERRPAGLSDRSLSVSLLLSSEVRFRSRAPSLLVDSDPDTVMGVQREGLGLHVVEN